MVGHIRQRMILKALAAPGARCASEARRRGGMCTAPRRHGRGPGLRDQVQVAGAGDGVTTAGRLQLGEDVADVALDCGQGKEEPSGDLLVGAAGGQESQHLQLALGKRFGEWLGGGSGGSVRTGIGDTCGQPRGPGDRALP